MATITTVISRNNPYVGPRPYREGEPIYGRERETSELLDILIAERIVLLYSASGAGKSSLLNAAILPKMAEQGFQVYPVIRLNLEPPNDMTLGDDFNRYIYSAIQSIEEGLPEEQRFTTEELVKLKFKDYLAKFHARAHELNPDTNTDAPILLVFDQAEEVIRIMMTDRPKKQDFFAQLGEVLRDKNIWALIAMREDYLASFDPYLRPIPTRLANRYRLTFLDTEAAIKAVQLPANSESVEFPDACARQLVDDLRATLVQQQDGTTTQELGPVIEPVQLQVVCRRLWSNLPVTETVVTPEHIKALGSVNRALADYYALQTASIANMSHIPERNIREWFQRKLITTSGIRGQVLLTPEQSEGLSNETIWMLERAYLIRAEKRGGATWFELAHDRLVRPITENNNNWFETHLNMIQRRADLWNQQGRPDSLLLIGPEFPTMDTWMKANTQTATLVEKDFYRDSLKSHQNMVSERRTEILIRWLLVGSVIAGLVAAFFYFRAHVAEQRALARELAAASLSSMSSLQNNPELGTLLAIKALEATTDPMHEAIQSLHQALPQMRLVRSSLNSENGHKEKVYCVVYSPIDGKYMASASKDGTVKIWDSSTLQVIKTLQVVPDTTKYYGYGAFVVAYSPDGKFLAVVGADGRLIVFETTNWTVKYQVNAHEKMILALAYSNDGKYIATGGEESKAKVWDAATGKLVYELDSTKGNQSGIEVALFSLDNKTLFIGGDNDRKVYAWDMTNGQFAYELDPQKNADGHRVNGLAISPDGKTLASSGSDRVIRQWDLATQKLRLEIPGHSDWIYTVAYSKDGKTLVSVGADRTIRVWDADYGRSKMVLAGQNDQVYWVSFNPTGRYIATAGADSSVRIWDISVQGSYEIMTIDAESRVRAVRFSPNGNYITSAGADGTVRLWDAKTGALVKTLKDKGVSAEAISWNHDGRYLAVGYNSGETMIWDMTTNKPALVIPGNQIPIWSVSFNSDNSLVAISNSVAIIYIYNTKTGQEVIQIDANRQLGWGFATASKDLWLSTILFSPDGDHLAAGYSNGKIIIWDSKTGKPAITIDEAHSDIIEGLAYNKDGSLLASTSDDGLVVLWDMSPRVDKRKKMTFSGHIATVNDVAFSADGNFLVSGGADELVKIWNTHDGNKIVQPDLYGNSNLIRSVDISPDNTHIISGSDDNSVRLFSLDLEEVLEQAKKRVTRTLTDDECYRYLHVKPCTNFPPPDLFGPITDLVSRYLYW